MAHITGGGLPENLPRCLGANQGIKVNHNSWEILPIFQWLSQVGQVSLSEMFNTFNMGIGFVVLVSPTQVQLTLNWFNSQGIAAWEIGEVISGEGELVMELP
jgi:phosphoribosylformylglycinamidine cyclo-ligase